MDWLLGIMQPVDFIEGKTRLQKIAFLIQKEHKDILNQGFYGDWAPSKYGPFSANLANDLEAGIETGFIVSGMVPNEYGYKVARFALSDSGKTRLAIFMQDAKVKGWIMRITPMVTRYAKEPLTSVLHDVYYSSPEYTTLSGIKAEVVGRTGLKEKFYVEDVTEESDDS
ncbi:MAG TPA: hypothetical protein VGS11_04905 [Candidatus Bathyarchaeia archaeon]|nr:hypothetical protein [Candidatus Bathyarchaeia archaeon]